MSVRLAEARDIPAMLGLYAPYISTTVTFEYTLPTPEEFLRRFHTFTAQLPWLVYEEQGEVLGYAYASLPFERAAYQWCAEPSIYLAKSVQGKGVGKLLYRCLEEILRQQGYQVLYALVTSENAPSLAFHEALGYVRRADFPACGFKNNRWLGVIWLEKRLASVESPSNFPIKWQDVVENNENLQKVLSKITLS